VPTKYDVLFAPLAKRDLENIWTYIAEDNRAAATNFIKGIERQVAALEIFPERCPLIPENSFLGTQLRHLIFGDYRTVFRMAGRKVYILRCIHGSRLLEKTDESDGGYLS
jgi:plasmid stabilization system protein ParE